MRTFFIVIFMCTAVCLLNSCKKDEPKKNNTIVNQPLVTDLRGSWAITGTLITTTNPDPNAPQPGFQAMENWVIDVVNNVPVVTTPKGSANGSGVSNGYHFEGQYDVSPGYVWATFVTEVFPSVQYNKLYGTSETKYYGLNGVNQPMFLGTESWQLAGSKL